MKTPRYSVPGLQSCSGVPVCINQMYYSLSFKIGPTNQLMAEIVHYCNHQNTSVILWPRHHPKSDLSKSNYTRNGLHRTNVVLMNNVLEHAIPRWNSCSPKIVWLNNCCTDLALDTCIHIIISPTLRLCRFCKCSPKVDKDPLTPHIEYHGCWCPSDARNQALASVILI